jgi:PhnB protein
MMSKVKPIPDGYHNVTPYLIVNDAAAAIEYYKKALGATEVMRMPTPAGKIMHAELQFGDSRVMLADECKEMGAVCPATVGGSPVTIMLYVENVDKTVDLAVAEGATLVRPVADQFYGDRSGGFVDPFGHKWYIATHIEDVPPEEMGRRAAEAQKEAQKQKAGAHA